MDSRVVLVTGGIGLLAFIWYRANPNRKLQAERPGQQLVLERGQFKEPGACNQILTCKGYDNSGAKNRYTNIESRALSNARLVDAYGIDNSFTTSDSGRNKDFKLEATKAIEMTEAQWRAVAGVAKELVHQAVSPPKLTAVGQTKSATLDSVVRSVCLKIVLHLLFKLEPLRMDDGKISTITELINSLWIQSKGTGMRVESDKQDLHKALIQLNSQFNPSNPRENPLNLILPAYETLWRVVLSGFLQVNFVGGVSPTSSLVLKQFLANPTISSRKLELGQGASAVSVDLVVKETLRLYPSVKRVYRRFNMDSAAGPENVAADIEACQRSKALWGADAERFVPSRWNHASDEAQASYMAFGVSPLGCPAKPNFGPMLIGILVAAFAGHVSSEDWRVELSEGSSENSRRDLDKALNGEMPLASDRSTYEGIRIIQK